MKLLLVMLAVMLSVSGSANAAKDQTGVVKKNFPADTIQQGVVNPGADEPEPLPTGCGNVVYQYVPGESGAIDLDVLNVANGTLDLALEAADFEPIAAGDSIEGDILEKSLRLAEYLEKLCRSGRCRHGD